jgi:hypothetical protein
VRPRTVVRHASSFRRCFAPPSRRPRPRGPPRAVAAARGAPATREPTRRRPGRRGRSARGSSRRGSGSRASRRRGAARRPRRARRDAASPLPARERAPAAARRRRGRAGRRGRAARDCGPAEATARVPLPERQDAGAELVRASVAPGSAGVRAAPSPESLPGRCDRSGQCARKTWGGRTPCKMDDRPTPSRGTLGVTNASPGRANRPGRPGARVDAVRRLRAESLRGGP